ncbi:VOC family protein [Salirhabdus sp. Marseille-P4669]|uniref:VOC family protein n=1 Tax=Salirhabdus sp. Marseille-P4669 TaxID=2042310 RepID=UPI000C7D6879|nr:VOC family protein [Salirhabdus sp. Marseille-P4669]
MYMQTSKKPIVKGVGGAGIKVKSLNEMVRWYGRLLNMPISTFNPDIPFYVFDMDNRVNLTLDDYRNMKGLKHFPIAQFKTEHIQEAKKVVQASKVPIVLDIQRPHPGLAYFHIEDSEGNVLQLVESDWINPKPLKQNSEAHPIQNHLQNLVIPVKDIDRASKWYSSFLGVSLLPERLDGGPINWFDLEDGTGILLDDNRNNSDFKGNFPTIMLRARDIQEAFEFVKQNEIEVIREITHHHYFVIRDLEDHTIIICP